MTISSTDPNSVIDRYTVRSIPMTEDDFEMIRNITFEETGIFLSDRKLEITFQKCGIPTIVRLSLKL